MSRPPLSPRLMTPPELALHMKQVADKRRNNDYLKAIILGIGVFFVLYGAIELAIYHDEKCSQVESTE